METSTRSYDEEYESTMRSIHESRMKKAGLFGEYARADSDEGHTVYERAKAGNGSYLYGPCGTGKTYAAACAIRLALKDGAQAKLITTKAYLDLIKAKYNGEESPSEKLVSSVPLLALDDIGMERLTPWAMEELSGLVDVRSSMGLPTIFTSNFKLGEIRDRWGGIEGARVVSRIAGACEVIEMCGADRRLEKRVARASVLGTSQAT